MTIFKNYFKIVNKHKFSILIYSITFILLVMVNSSSGKSTQEGYKSVEVDIFVENNSDSEVAKGLEEYLNKSFEVVKLDEKNIEDELFYGTVSAIVTIPKDFNESYMVEYKASPNSMYGMLPKQKINNYISRVKSYEDSSFSKEDAIKYSMEDLSKSIRVGLSEKQESGTKLSAAYFNFLHYILMSQIMLIVGTVMFVYKDEVINKRNEVSPISAASQNLQLTMGHLVTGIFIWLSYMVVYYFIDKGGFSTKFVKLMMLNSFVFMISVVTLSLLLTRLIKNKNSMSAITNIVTIGTSFVAGAFVPQELLSDFTVNISKVLPSYYFIKGNNMLVENAAFSVIRDNLLIMLAFSIAFIVISIILKKKLRK